MAKAGPTGAAALGAALDRAARAYFDERRARVDGFAAAQFGLRGSLRLHRAALGWDILRAPVNLALAPAAVAVRLGALAVGAAGGRRAAAWLRGQRLLLVTDVARAVQHAVVCALLELPMQDGGAADRDALAAAILAEPEVRARLATLQASRRDLAEYVDGRAAVAEFAVGVGALGVGAAAFQQVTPGMLSLGPALAASLAQQAAIAAFPLGASAGAIWHGLFPAAASPALAVGATLGLVGLGAVAVAFAGVLADPVQLRLGLHQRRLRRLIDAMERGFFADAGPGFLAREHYLARVLDLADAAGAAMRLARG